MKKPCEMLISLCLLCAVYACSTGANVPDDIIRQIKGKWAVTVPDAFPGFQNYALTIRDTDNTIDIKGEEFDIKGMKFVKKDGKLWANLYINGAIERVALWAEDGAIKGITKTDTGDAVWIFKKVE